MNRPLPPGDRGPRGSASRRPRGRTWPLPGAFGLVGGIAQDRAVAVTPVLADQSVETSGPEPVVLAQVPEPTVIARDETPVVIPDKGEDSLTSADRVLPETAGHSVSKLIVGVAVLALGLVTVFVGLRRAEA